MQFTSHTEEDPDLPVPSQEVHEDTASYSVVASQQKDPTGKIFIF